MQEVFCQECGRKIEVNLYHVDAGIASGDLVQGQKMVKFKNHQGDIVDQFIDGTFDICKVCQGKMVVRAGDPSFLQSKRILHKIHLLREMRPDLTEDERRSEAIREEFDPQNEPNRAFRAYLLERSARDPENDAAASRALEALV